MYFHKILKTWRSVEIWKYWWIDRVPTELLRRPHLSFDSEFWVVPNNLPKPGFCFFIVSFCCFVCFSYSKREWGGRKRPAHAPICWSVYQCFSVGSCMPRVYSPQRYGSKLGKLVSSGKKKKHLHFKVFSLHSYS